MSRPSISLACIAKNEAKHVKRFLESFSPAVDEVIFCDTGSTDGTIEIAQSMGAKVIHFDWVNDFSAARNFSFSNIKTDYALWADLDDSLKGREAFIEYRDYAMKHHDYVLAKYNYALDSNGNPLVSFARERIVSMRWKPRWNYFLHEGIPPAGNIHSFYCSTWSIDHLRTAEDLAKDKSRNINIFKHQMQTVGLDARMQFYFGKELFENNEPQEAEQQLLKAFTMPNLQPHDRLNCMQYLALSALGQIERLKPEHWAKELVRLRKYCHDGLLLDPGRAEFFVLLGDSYLREMKLSEARPFFEAAKGCSLKNMPNQPFAGPIHANPQAYTDYPRQQLTKILVNMGDINGAEKEAIALHEQYPTKVSEELINEISRIKPLIKLDGPKTKCEDIVFTCPPQTAYPFDEEIYKTKPLGGSETALVEMARWIKKLTGRPVKVFNMRDNHLVADSGVEYFPASQVNAYFERYEPKLHIAWRHNIKITNAQTVAWCHDLTMPGAEYGHNFDKILALTPFHKNYLASAQGIPREKIILTRNGIDPDKLKVFPAEKDPNKVVWMSSPDRGLDRAMKVLDVVRKKYPEIKLHVYYGLENLYKYGLAERANTLKQMMAERPWVIYHGFTEQKQMYEEVKDAALWLHPCDFIETFCITALEMLSLGVYPVTRRLGGLEDTLKEAESLGMATLLDHDCVTDEEISAYAMAFMDAYEAEAWKTVKIEKDQFAWSGVAQEWVKEFQL